MLRRRQGIIKTKGSTSDHSLLWFSPAGFSPANFSAVVLERSYSDKVVCLPLTFPLGPVIPSPSRGHITVPLLHDTAAADFKKSAKSLLVMQLGGSDGAWVKVGNNGEFPPHVDTLLPC